MARGQIAVAGPIIMLILLSVIVVGTGAGMLIPQSEVGDGAFPYLVKNVIGGWVSLPILLVITAAIHSTTDGLLHIVGALLPGVTFGNGTPTPGPPGRRHATGKADL